MTQPLIESQPNITAQQELLSIDGNFKTTINIPRSKKKFKIGWLRPFTTNRITRVYLENDAPNESIEFLYNKSKVVAKIASYIILNNFWTIKFCHGFHWRWLYYVKQYDYEQLQPIIIEGKKKMAVEGFYVSMALSATMMDTTKTMMKQEAKQFLQELSSATDRLSERNTLRL